MVVGERILGISGSPRFFFFFGLRGFRLRELAHGFLDEKEEIQIPNHFHPGGADCSPLREWGSLLQGPAAGWRGLCQLVVKVGAGAVLPAWGVGAKRGAKRGLRSGSIHLAGVEVPLGAQRSPGDYACLGQVCTRQD